MRLKNEALSQSLSRKGRSILITIVAALSISLLAQQSAIPSSLRGGIKADKETIKIALVMQEQGWIYIMPEPKSPQAAWGNKDGRTTWYVGYWKNTKSGETSDSTPRLVNGKYVGDGQGGPGWRRGGSPSAPTKLLWLLSKCGGVPPRG